MNILDLDRDALHYVFALLPLKDKFLCRAVCHTWKEALEEIIKRTDRILITDSRRKSEDSFIFPAIPCPSYQQCQVTRDHLISRSLDGIFVARLPTIVSVKKLMVFAPSFKVFVNDTNNPAIDIIECRESLECLADLSFKGSMFLVNVRFPKLTHVQVAILPDQFLDNPNLHPALESLTFFHSQPSDGGEDDAFKWRKLPKGLKQFHTSECVFLRALLESPARETLEDLYIGLDVTSLNDLNKKDEKYFTKIRHLRLDLSCMEEINFDRNRRSSIVKDFLPYWLFPTLTHLSIIDVDISSYFFYLPSFLRRNLLESFAFKCATVTNDIATTLGPLLPKTVFYYTKGTPKSEEVAHIISSCIVPLVNASHGQMKHFQVHFNVSSISPIMHVSEEILHFVESFVVTGRLESFGVTHEIWRNSPTSRVALCWEHIHHLQNLVQEYSLTRVTFVSGKGEAQQRHHFTPSSLKFLDDNSNGLEILFSDCGWREEGDEGSFYHLFSQLSFLR